jgi:hypothetical protein
MIKHPCPQHLGRWFFDWIKVMKTNVRYVWVVILCEIADRKGHVLEAVSHVASSLKSAEQNLRDGYIASFSWWRVERWHLDDATDEPGEVHFYSHTGRARKSTPKTVAVREFEKLLVAKSRRHQAKASP